MDNQKLIKYINQQLQQNISKEKITNTLLNAEWEKDAIDEAFQLASNIPIPTPQQTISSLPGAADLLGQSWAIYKKKIGTFLVIMAIPILVVIFLMVAFVGIGFLINSRSANFINNNIGPFIFLLILLFGVSFVIQAWGQLSLLYAIKDSNEDIGAIDCYRRSWHKILSYWWISLLVGFITLGGFFLLFIPGIIFAIWFSLAVFILVAEDIKGMNALLKSKEYVRGNWGEVFLRFLFIGGIFLIVSFILLIIVYLFRIPYGEGIIRIVIGFFAIPLAMTYSFLIYRDLKRLKGEITLPPNGGKKTAFILAAILGLLIIPLILSSLAFFRFNSGFDSARVKSRDNYRESDLKQIQIFLDLYYEEYDNYPHSLDALSPDYITTIPVDPQTNESYQYQLIQDGDDYRICAKMEEQKQMCLSSTY